jgi:hypothetical protein
MCTSLFIFEAERYIDVINETLYRVIHTKVPHCLVFEAKGRLYITPTLLNPTRCLLQRINP